MENNHDETIEKDIATLTSTPTEEITDQRVTLSWQEGAGRDKDVLEMNRDSVVNELKSKLGKTNTTTKVGYTESYAKGYEEINWSKKD